MKHMKHRALIPCKTRSDAPARACRWPRAAAQAAAAASQAVARAAGALPARRRRQLPLPPPPPGMTHAAPLLPWFPPHCRLTAAAAAAAPLAHPTVQRGSQRRRLAASGSNSEQARRELEEAVKEQVQGRRRLRAWCCRGVIKCFIPPLSPEGPVRQRFALISGCNHTLSAACPPARPAPPPPPSRRLQDLWQIPNREQWYQATWCAADQPDWSPARFVRSTQLAPGVRQAPLLHLASLADVAAAQISRMDACDARWLPAPPCIARLLACFPARLPLSPPSTRPVACRARCCCACCACCAC